MDVFKQQGDKKKHNQSLDASEKNRNDKILFFGQNHSKLFQNHFELKYFHKKFESKKDEYNQLRKSIIHNDINDNNSSNENEQLAHKQRNEALKSAPDFINPI